MLEAALVAVRLAQYAGAAILFGASLFLLYALPRGQRAPAWAAQLLTSAAVLTAVAALVGLVVQTTSMAGSLAFALQPDSLRAVALEMPLGRAALIRAGAGALAVVALIAVPKGPRLWAVLAFVGAVAAGSLAWMGHGAAKEDASGRLHLFSDVLHSVAAAAWLGALPCFLLLVVTRPREVREGADLTHHALKSFSGVGMAAVAVLVGTGLVNSWFLVGFENLRAALATTYGQLLATKLALFGLMLILAAANRYRLTPALGASTSRPEAPLLALRRSVLLETLAGFGVLLLVAWLGTLSPPVSV